MPPWLSDHRRIVHLFVLPREASCVTAAAENPWFGFWYCCRYGCADPATGIYHPGVGSEADPALPAPVDGPVTAKWCVLVEPEQPDPIWVRSLPPQGESRTTPPSGAADSAI